MEGWLATQVLNASVSNSLKLLESNKIGFKKFGSTIEFIQICNSLFYILNSKSIKESYEKRAL